MGMKPLSYTLVSATLLLILGGVVWAYTKGKHTAPPPSDISATSTISMNPTSLIPSVISNSYPTLKSHKFAATVLYKSSGFTPAQVHIKAGQVVHFINASSAGMRVYYAGQGAAAYIELDEQKVVGRGGTYDFLFNRPGTWGYYNLVGDPSHTGVVIVDHQ